MDREEIEKLKKLSENATLEIRRLQLEIERYKSGADSFEEATCALKNLAAVNSEMMEKMEGLVKTIPELDTKRVRKMGSELSEAVNVMKRMTERVETSNRETRKEIRLMKDEILEKLKDNQRKGFRLFGKK